VVLAEFENLSGLKANPNKSSFFCSGIQLEDKESMLNLLQMQEGSLLVRYLGVPLISKRLSAVDCEDLVAKIAGRIDSWLVKHLSFAGRLQLLSSVLFSLQVFWARVFILPKKIIRIIEQKFNRFMGSGADSRAKAKVAWDKICFPKSEGGLGIKKLEIWNQAAMLNHIWSLFAQAGSLWVAWVELKWFKGKSFWQISIPKVCSWSWKKLLKLRDIAKKFIRFKIGDGNRTYLWLDNWHPLGRLVDRFGFRIVYDSGSCLEAKVSSIIRNGDWFWPKARSDILVDIQIKLSDIPLGGTDVPIWESSSGVYTCSETWDSLRTKLPIVPWSKVIWFSQAIPQQAFVLWLIFRNALSMKDRMCGWGYMGNSLCCFCYACQESVDHLFFCCSFSRRIWYRLMSSCLVTNPRIDWDDVTSWSIRMLRGKSMQSTLCKLCLAAAVYNL
jgi:hypothetical protein